jgi:hypothetical protein
MSKSYTSVVAMLKGTGASSDMIKKVERGIQQSQLVWALLALRCQQNMTPVKIAKKLGWTTRKVLSFEDQTDAQVKISDLQAYVKALGGKLTITFSPKKGKSRFLLTTI